MNIGADLPGWSFASAGVIAGANVLGVLATQAHDPFLGIFANSSNPLRIWTGTFTPANYEPRFVRIQATPSTFAYYPNSLTPSSAECSAAPGRVGLFINPIQWGPLAAAPGVGTGVEVRGDDLVAEAQEEAILIALLVPAVQKVRIDAGAPLGFSVQVQLDPAVPTDQFSLNYTKVEFAYRTLAEFPSAQSLRYVLRRDGVVVGEVPSRDGLYLDRLPNTHSARLEPGVRTEESVFISQWEYDAPSRVFLPNGGSLVVDSVEVHASCQNNLHQIGLAVHSYESRGTPRVVLSLDPDDEACPADFNNDGGIDGADVVAFFSDWENGLPGADIDDDGGVDGADVSRFFTLWEAGGCR